MNDSPNEKKVNQGVRQEEWKVLREKDIMYLDFPLFPFNLFSHFSYQLANLSVNLLLIPLPLPVVYLNMDWGGRFLGGEVVFLEGVDVCGRNA